MNTDETSNHTSNTQEQRPVRSPGKTLEGEKNKQGTQGTVRANGKEDNSNQPSLIRRFTLKHFPESTAHDRWNLGFTVVIAFSTFLYMVFAGWTLWEIHSGSIDTHNLAAATKILADDASTSVKQFYDKTQRPYLRVKPPDSFRVEAGKPVATVVEVLNSGRASALVRARIHVEIGEGIIEQFRDNARDNPSTAEWVPDSKGVPKFLIIPGEGRKDFPIESSQRILTKQDLDKIAAGTIEVAAYGRIWYSDLAHAEYNSIFCFYLLKDRTVSACPDQEHAYTNFSP